MKETEIVRYLTSSLDDAFIKIYKQIKLIEVKQGIDREDYHALKGMYREILSKHHTDNSYMYDWFPILTKIQKHNRKMGLPNDAVSNASYKYVSPLHKRKQRKFTDIGNDAGDDDLNRVPSVTKIRSKSVNWFEDDNVFCIRKELKEGNDEGEYRHEPSKSLEKKVKSRESNNDKYNFLKILRGSFHDMSFRDKKESTKAMLLTKPDTN